MSIMKKITFSNIKNKFIIYLEKARGIDFLMVATTDDLGYKLGEGYHSSPSGNQDIKTILLDLSITHIDSIIDIGSGKGSALVTMCKFPFKRISGVELSKEMFDIALQNIKILKLQSVSIYNNDATKFEYYKEYNIFYMYNPFPSPIMKLVMKELNNIGKDKKDEIIIIYNHPTCHTDILDGGVFSKIKGYSTTHNKKMFIYSNKNIKDSRLC